MAKLKLQLCAELCGIIEVLNKSLGKSALTIVKPIYFTGSLNILSSLSNRQFF